MHPNRAFAWDDVAALRVFIQTHGFAQISLAAEGRVLCAHAPLVVGQDGAIRFHLARSNELVPLLDGRMALATVVADDAYISPDWYGTADQVPTWNYRLVEIEGVVRRLDDAELIAQLDALSAAQEARLPPKPLWTSAKMTPGRLEAMARAIVGFAIEAPELRGLAKLGQNKTAAERAGAIAGLRAIGRTDTTDAMETA